jgi:predicted P-loop ATPase
MERPRRAALMDDNDNQGLYWYFEKAYQMTKTVKIDAALSLHSAKHAFNDVQGYLNGLTWDGIPRLDTLFIDYLGAEDTPYTRAVTRKVFAAAVARAITPGVKFDYMTILSGPQGIGKSTLLSRMSRGWFNDSIRTFEGKEASELLQGVWLVEISELDAFRRTDISRIKQFLSLQADRFRAAYGRHVKEMPRCCVFFGTTNNREYLQDKTGNRRFWPVDVGIQTPTKSIFRDLDDNLDQLWAEAVVRWKLGEALYLDGNIAAVALEQQEGHRESSPYEGMILDFLDQKVPEDWNRWTQAQRQMFWSGSVAGDPPKLAERDRVCALEIWVECLGNDIRAMRNTDSTEINGTIAMAPGWKRMSKTAKFGPYGTQRGFQIK